MEGNRGKSQAGKSGSTAVLKVGGRPATMGARIGDVTEEHNGG